MGPDRVQASGDRTGRGVDETNTVTPEFLTASLQAAGGDSAGGRAWWTVTRRPRPGRAGSDVAPRALGRGALDDPAGRDLATVHSVRGEIERRVRKLLDQLGRHYRQGS